MEDEESLKATCIVSQLSDLVSSSVNHFFANSVVSPGIIICRIFLASQKEVWFKQISIISSLDLICKEITLVNMFQ